MNICVYSKTLFISVSICALVFGFTACSNSSDISDAKSNNSKPAAPATLLLGNFVTMNPDQPRANAVVIQEDKIIGVGEPQQLGQQFNHLQLTTDTRFKDKTLMPGFIDNHLHPTLAGILLPSKFITPYDWKLPNREIKGVQGREQYLARLTELLAETNSANEPLFITWGYHQYFHGEISRTDLDIVAPNRAIIMWHRSFHEVILNSAALQGLGIDTETASKNPNINIDKGHFWELGLFAIFPKLAPYILSPERMQSGMVDGFRHAQENGVTTVADQGFPLMNFDLELDYLVQSLQQHTAPTRMMIVANGKTLAPPITETNGDISPIENSFIKALNTIDELPKKNTAHISFLPKQVKLLADGAFYSQLMQMQEGYIDGHHGEWIMPPAELEQAMRVFWQADYQLHIHVNGDQGVNVLLDIIERLNIESPRQHKTVFHHYGYSAEDHAERLAELGISVSANPYYLWALGDKYSEVGLGPERAKNIVRLGDLERNGVAFSFHSDLPMAPTAPLKLASIAASRITAIGNLLSPNERVSTNAALRGITIDAARAIQQDHRIGSIEVGKLADFTVLETNPLTTAPEALATIPVIGTIIGGSYFDATSDPTQ